MLIKDAAWGLIDVETTGLSAETDRIVEAAIVWGEIGGICAEASWMFDPGMPIPASASAIHHIVDEDVKGCQNFNSERFFSGEIIDVDFYAAHNAEFDGSFLKPVPKPLVCTMRLAQKLWSDFESHSNQFLRYRLGLKPPIDRHAACHRALPDALVNQEQPGDVLHVSLSVQSETQTFVRKPKHEEIASAIVKWFRADPFSWTGQWGEKQPNVFHIFEKKS